MMLHQTNFFENEFNLGYCYKVWTRDAFKEYWTNMGLHVYF